MTNTIEARGLPAAGVKGEIRTLTSLRGVAALGVILYHFRNQFGSAIQPDLLTPFFQRSFMLVDFFFILSGFVIALSYATLFQECISGRNYAIFLLKRFGRIYPLHVAVLAAFVASEAAKYLVATSADPPFSVNTFGALVANLFLVQAWGIYDHFTWNHPAWSISTEWFAYLVFPFIALATTRLRSLATIVLAAIACFLALAWVIRIGGAGGLGVPPSMLLLRCIPSFILGMLIYQLRLLISGPLLSFFESDTAIVASMAACALVLATHVYDLFAIGAFFFAVLTGCVSTGRVAVTMSKGAFYFLGEISYSVYLVHTLLLRAWQMLFQVVWHNHTGTIEAWAMFAILVAAAIAVSTATYHLIERPGRDFVSKRLVPRLRVRASSPARG